MGIPILPPHDVLSHSEDEYNEEEDSEDEMLEDEEDQQRVRPAQSAAPDRPRRPSGAGSRRGSLPGGARGACPPVEASRAPRALSKHRPPARRPPQVLEQLELNMGNSVVWSLTIPEAAAAHPDLAALPPEEQRSINTQFMASVLCAAPAVTVQIPRDCFCYTMSLDQGEGAGRNPPRRVAVLGFDGANVTYRCGRPRGRVQRL